MKKGTIILLILVILIAGLAVGKDVIAKTAIEKGARIVTGLELTMKSFNMGILKTSVGIKELKLFNPLGFEDRVMLDMPEIYVDYDLPALFAKKIHLREMRIDLKEFVIVKNKDGESNLDKLKAIQQPKEGEAKEEKGKGAAPEMRIDNLHLKIGKVVMKDYSGKSPSVREIQINLDETFKNIDSPNELVSLIVFKALINTPFAALANVNMGALGDSVSGALSGAGEVAGAAVDTAGKTLKAGTEGAGKAVEGAGKAVGEVGDAIKKIKLPFGGDK
ncbi:MAG: hypothetical protein JW844_07535 [Candidatus Omnitrophica bacterium]|nr:hypothetical protein [Candidatus Omnitrophota bacterium]